MMAGPLEIDMRARPQYHELYEEINPEFKGDESDYSDLACVEKNKVGVVEYGEEDDKYRAHVYHYEGNTWVVLEGYYQNPPPYVTPGIRSLEDVKLDQDFWYKVDVEEIPHPDDEPTFYED